MANPRWAEQGKFRGPIPRKGTQDAPNAALVVVAVIVVVSILRTPPFAQEDLVHRQKILEVMMGIAGQEELNNKERPFIPRNCGTTNNAALWNQLHAAGDGPRQPEEAATGPTTKRSPAESRGNEEQPQNPITLHALKSVNAADMQTKSARGEQLEEIQKAEGVLVQQQKDQILEQQRELALLQQQLAKQQQAQQQQPGAAESAAAASPAAASPAAATPAAATPAAPSPSPSGISPAAESPAAADHQGEQQAEKSRKDPATAAAAAATPQPAALNTTATTEAAMAAATDIVPRAEPELTEAQKEQIEQSKKNALLLRAQLAEKRKAAAQLAEEKKHQPSSSASTGQGEDSQASAPAAAAVDSASNSSGSARPEEDAVAAPAMNID